MCRPCRSGSVVSPVALNNRPYLLVKYALVRYRYLVKDRLGNTLVLVENVSQKCESIIIAYRRRRENLFMVSFERYDFFLQ